MIKTIIVSAFFLVTYFTTFGDYLEFKKDKEIHLLGSQLSLVETSPLTTLQVIQSDTINWFTSDGLYFHAGEEKALWGKFTIWNKSGKPVFAEFTDHRIDELTFYDPKGERVKTGDHLPFLSRWLHHKNFVFYLPESRSPKTYYFKLQSLQRVGALCKIRSIERFINYSLGEYIFLGMFYGIILIITLLNLLSYLKLRQQSYLYYSLYVLSLGLFSACQDGIAYQYLWSGSSNWNETFAFMLCCYIVFELIYVATFLNLKEQASKIYHLFKLLVLLRILYFLIGILFYKPLLYKLEIDDFHLLVVLITAIWVYKKKKYQPAKKFLFGFSFLLIGYLLYTLMDLALLPINPVTVYATQIGAVIEFVILTYAFAEKIRYERALREAAQTSAIASLEERNTIQRNVNEELEKKVMLRTEEIGSQNELLSQKNEELASMQKKLWQMNAEMDKLNWKLSKDVEQHVSKRVQGELVKYENFMKVYPTERSVLIFLHDIKTKEPYRCKKCKNNKCKDDQENYQQICTSCGYKESATVSTLLQGTRLEKRKALYLVYLFLTQPDTNVKELADDLNMRVATLYDLRKKVFDISNKKKVSDWSNSIVFK